MFTDACRTEGGNVKDQPNWFPKVHRMPSEWVMPDTFPDLSGYDEIAIDLETRDPGLKSKGSGALINEGEIVGIAVAVEGWSGYYSFGHKEGNFFDESVVMGWIKEICALPNVKLFHTGEKEQGLDLFMKCVQKLPQIDSAWASLGTAYTMNRQLEMAKTCYEN